MTTDQVLELIGILVGSGVLVFAVLAWLISKAQLRIALAEAEKHPILIVRLISRDRGCLGHRIGAMRSSENVH
jgi:hypothetical protein